MIEEITKDWPFAVVAMQFRGRGAIMYAAAALLFDTSEGFAFVTPAYKDPDGAGQHNFHVIEAKLERQSPDVVTFAGPDWSGTIERYEQTVLQLEQIGNALEWFEGLGLDLADERQRIRTVLGPDLA